MLKRCLISEFLYCKQKRLTSLISVMTLDDNQPSPLLHKICQLARNGLSEKLLKTLWLRVQWFYNQPQAILFISDNKLHNLAITVDKIIEVAVPITQDAIH